MPRTPAREFVQRRLPIALPGESRGSKSRADSATAIRRTFAEHPGKRRNSVGLQLEQDAGSGISNILRLVVEGPGNDVESIFVAEPLGVS